MAMENTHTPTALILSRQNINDLPAPEGKSRKEAAEAATRGGYIVLRDENPEVVLIANGSEVSTLVEGAALLRKDGIRLQIVAVPSEGLFRRQSQEYQDEVLPRGIRRFGLTAGLPVTLQGLVGDTVPSGGSTPSDSRLPTRCWTKSSALLQTMSTRRSRHCLASNHYPTTTVQRQ